MVRQAPARRFKAHRERLLLAAAAAFTIVNLVVAGIIFPPTAALLNETQPVPSNAFTTSAAFVRVARGSFPKATTVAPPNQTQSITGVGFQPKAVIFFWTRQTAAGFAATQSMGVGFTTGPAAQRAVAIAEDDAAGTSNAGRRKSEARAIILLSNGTPTLAAEASLASLDLDGFTLTWTTNDARADIIHYIALGGDGLTNASAGTFNLTTATGNQAVTGVGFQPGFVLFLSGFTGANDTNLAFSELSLGMASSSTARGAIVVATRDNQASNGGKRSQQRTDAAILLLTDAAPPAQDAIADFVSMDADGFTVNKSNAPAASTPIFYLALKGGEYQVGNFTQPAATGAQTVTGVGFQPRLVSLFSQNKAAGTSITAPNKLSLGAAISPTARGSVWSEALNVDPSDTNSYTSATDVLTLASSPSTVNARADFSSFVPDGFTITWSAADATARQVVYWAIR